jgi:DNA-directed RNA polymerase specialized sigma subunit
VSTMSVSFASADRVIRGLVRYTDWWQPSTASVYTITGKRGSSGDGISPGLLETLDERTELCRRMATLSERDRQLLFLWYVKQDDVLDIARALHISRRQCFRVRSNAIRALVDEDPDRAA